MLARLGADLKTTAAKGEAGVGSVSRSKPDDGRKVSQRRLGLELSRADLRLLADYRVFFERKGLRRSSIVSFIYKLRLLAEHVFPRDLLSATSEDGDAFADARQLGARARYLYISTIHGLYHWAVIYGRAKRDPTLRVVRPRWPRSIPRPIPDGDLRRLIAAAPQRELAMIARRGASWA